MSYDCIIIGGGIAGLQAAIQLGRYQRHVLVIDTGYGRSTLCRSYHNLLGWPDGVSGETLRQLGQQHAQALGISFVQDEAVHVEKVGGQFVVSVKNGDVYRGKRLLLATGVLDRFPPLPGLIPCLGLTVYICPDCDGYEVRNKKTVVLGSGKSGAHMALTLTYWTKDVTYINHEQQPLPEELSLQLASKSIPHLQEPAEHIVTGDEEWRICGVRLRSGQMVEAERGFLAFGGNEVKSDLAAQLGVERLENKHIVTDPRTKMTNVKHVWAAGDVTVHSEQVTIAMGEGSQAAIWIHKSLLGEH
ncbi:thioredoxin reductase [Caldalkalibacillus uzonensis]|uniref:Thioredoxin reductase n=1 Tax=Caldalkalibacillus uzonensis TaxID=353224 RepID=A0ABU0CS66_9BACI|nr:NAD(P)/FAD-dependent oxidoreductase [Caldalkalibacillus uzonensis]MDQ0339266.1 thioredoxin reductase [Caldalkalibacillus uzonensis]